MRVYTYVFIKKALLGGKLIFLEKLSRLVNSIVVDAMLKK